mmetsp:Transcript_21221/g.70072  ORF Transcript_21221/g.70072 Transcript_21221/m.70072 type:complete len:372 (+) Transcript_21221:216-1331(+)
MVRPRGVVPARAARRLDDVPRPAAHRLGRPQRARGGWPARLAQRCVRLFARRLWRARGGLHGAAGVGGDAEAERGGARHGHHGHPPRPPHALHRRRLRQRVDCGRGDGQHLLPVGARAAVGRLVAGGAALRRELQLHGRRVGRLRLRPQHDWHPRGGSGAGRALLRAAVARLLPLVAGRHSRRRVWAGPLPGRVAAFPVARAARPDGGVRGAAAVAAVRGDGGQAAARLDGDAQAAAAAVRVCRRRRRRRRRRRPSGGLHRPDVCARAEPVHQAHQDGQPARRLGGGAPGDAAHAVLALLPLHPLCDAARPRHSLLRQVRREALPHRLHDRRLLLLRKDGAPPPPHLAGHFGLRRRLPRLPHRLQHRGAHR